MGNKKDGLLWMPSSSKDDDIFFCDFDQSWYINEKRDYLCTQGLYDVEYDLEYLWRFRVIVVQMLRLNLLVWWP